MFRRVRRWTVLILVAVAAGAAVLLLTTRPRLDDRHTAVETRWRATMPSAEQHVAALTQLESEVRKAGPTRDPSRAVAAALSEWSDATAGSDVAAQIRALNAVQGAGARLLAMVDDPNRRYRGVAAVQRARNAYTATALTPATVSALNASIDRYNDARNGVLRRLAADLLGDDALVKLAPEPAAA